MAMIGFPLLLIPLAICNILLFLMPGVPFAEPLVTLKVMSGTVWAVTLSDALLALGIVLLLFEVIKSGRPGGKYFTDHALALLVFAAAVWNLDVCPAGVADAGRFCIGHRFAGASADARGGRNAAGAGRRSRTARSLAWGA